LRLKWILTAVLVLVVALVASVVAILYSLDINQYRGEIAQRIEAATGRKVAIAGDLGLAISLNPTISAGQVTIANLPWGSSPEMMTIKRLETQVALMPLLSGRIDIQRFILVGADILLETDKKGAGNWTLTPGGAAAAGGTSGTGTSAGSASSFGGSFAVHEISIEDSALTYKDGVTGRLTKIALKSLTAESPSPAAPIQLEAAGSFNGNPLTLKGTVSGIEALAGGAPVHLDLDGEAGGAKLSVKGEITPSGDGAGADLQLGAEGHEIGDLSKLAGQPVPALGPYKINLHLVRTKEAIAAKAIDAVIGTDKTVLISATGAIADLVKPAGADVRVEIKGKSLASLSAVTGSPLPPIGPIAVAARVSDAPGAYRLKDLAANVGASDLAGDLTIKLGSPRPRIDGTLASNHFALADFGGPSPSDASATAKGGGASGGRVFPADPFPLDVLKLVDFNMAFSAKDAVLTRVQVLNMSVKASLADGRLSVAPFDAQLAGGSLHVEGSVDSSVKPSAIALKMTTRHVDVDKVMAILRVVQSSFSGGKADLDLNVEGHGDSVRALMAGLNGKTNLAMGQGRIDNGFAKLLLGDLFKLLTFQGNSDSSNINCFVSRFDIAGGLAQSTALVLDTNGATIVGGGTINLKTEGLDLSLDPKAKQTNLVNLAIPVKVGGTLAAPRVFPDPAGIAKGAAGALIGVTKLNSQNTLLGAVTGVLGGGSGASTGSGGCAIGTDATGAAPGASGQQGTSTAPAKTQSQGPVQDLVGGAAKSLDSLFGSGSKKKKKSP
jgi:AsmA family protein